MGHGGILTNVAFETTLGETQALTVSSLPEVATHIFNPIILEAEAGRWQIFEFEGLQSEFWDSH